MRVGLTRLLRVNSTYGFCQILGVRAFQHVSARSFCESPLYLGIRFESGEDDDPCFWKLCPNRDHGIDAAHVWKPEVHESHIGLVFTKTFDRLRVRSTLAPPSTCPAGN